MKKIILILISIFIIGIVTIAYYLGLFNQEEVVKKAKNPPTVTAFKPVDLKFTHTADKTVFPFAGASVIDVNNDGNMEIFLSGSKNQPNAVMSYKNEQFVDIAESLGLSLTDKAVYGATSFDIDNDNDTDLVITAHDGVWIYRNEGGQFTEQQLTINAPENSFPLNVAIADINNDGLADFYISNFVNLSTYVPATFNDPSHAKANIMLLNKGDGVFEDITEQTGTAGVENTFLSVFADLDHNGYQDLIVSNNTGPIEIFKNMGNLTFEPFDVSSDTGYWMGIGVGDIDKDGDQDLFFSNIGTSIPEKLVRGDLKDNESINLDWLVLRNDGNWSFTNVTKEYDLDNYGFAWGGVFEDINLDGDLDFLVAQNYINWPGHSVNKLPGKAFLQLSQDGKKGFYHLDDLGLNNPYYGQSPLIVDINNDAKPDVVWINMNGPSKAFLNTSNNKPFKVIVPDNIDYLGARVTLITDKGRSYTKEVMTNIGMTSDQTPNLFFGLGQTDKPQTLEIVKPNGEINTLNVQSAPNNTFALP